MTQAEADDAEVDADAVIDLASNNANVDVAKSNIKAQNATTGQLNQLVGYEQVLAPFDGVPAHVTSGASGS